MELIIARIMTAFGKKKDDDEDEYERYYRQEPLRLAQKQERAPKPSEDEDILIWGDDADAGNKAAEAKDGAEKAAQHAATQAAKAEEAARVAKEAQAALEEAYNRIQEAKRLEETDDIELVEHDDTAAEAEHTQEPQAENQPEQEPQQKEEPEDDSLELEMEDALEEEEKEQLVEAVVMKFCLKRAVTQRNSRLRMQQCRRKNLIILPASLQKKILYVAQMTLLQEPPPQQHLRQHRKP